MTCHSKVQEIHETDVLDYLFAYDQNKSIPTPECLSYAVSLLKKGEVLAFPTETVYGLGANALNTDAISKIFEAKGRPSDNPLIVHVSSIQMLLDITNMPTIYEKLIAKYWPGPLTILVPKGNLIPSIVTAGHETVAIRMPKNSIARALIA